MAMVCQCRGPRHRGHPGHMCGKTHGLTPSVRNKWHECTGCGAIYCDDCGRTCLPGKHGIADGTRTCPQCGARTQLVG